MYKFKKPRRTTIERSTAEKGETMEQKVRRILENNEPLNDGSPEMFDEGDSRNPATDPRTDIWELAVEGADIVSKNKILQKEANLKIVGKEETEENVENNVEKRGTKSE